MSDALAKKSQPKIDYTKVDPILKTNPRITFSEFKKECSVDLSQWTFYDRKSFLTTGKHLKERKAASTKNGTIKAASTRSSEITVAFIMANVAPKKSKLVKDYKRVAEILLKNPDAVHSQLKKEKRVKMCDANFYQFRKKIQTLLNGKTKEPEQTPTPTPRRKTTMYTLLFEKELGEKGMNGESREFIDEFIAELNRRKAMNLEIVEIISPRHLLEVRSY